jgi:hypothetical protein
MRKTVSVNMDLEIWNRFKEKYRGKLSKRLTYLIHLDLEGKLTSPKGEHDSETD